MFVISVTSFVFNLPCFKVLINESYPYFLFFFYFFIFFYDSHTSVDVISILSNT